MQRAINGTTISMMMKMPGSDSAAKTDLTRSVDPEKSFPIKQISKFKMNLQKSNIASCYFTDQSKKKEISVQYDVKRLSEHKQ